MGDNGDAAPAAADLICIGGRPAARASSDEHSDAAVAFFVRFGRKKQTAGSVRAVTDLGMPTPALLKKQPGEIRGGQNI